MLLIYLVEAFLIDEERKEAVKVEQLDLNKRLTQILRNITNSIRRFSKIHGSIKKKTKLPDELPVTIAPKTTSTTTIEPESSIPSTERPKHRPKPVEEFGRTTNRSSQSGEGQFSSTTTIEPLPRMVTPREQNAIRPHGGGDRQAASSTPNPDDVNTLVVDPNGRAILPGKTKIIYCTSKYTSYPSLHMYPYTI